MKFEAASSSRRLRVQANFLNGFNVIWAVQPDREKYSASRFAQINSITPAVPFPKEGRHAIVTAAERDAVAASGAKDERARFADGEVVWS